MTNPVGIMMDLHDAREPARDQIFGHKRPLPCLPFLSLPSSSQPPIQHVPPPLFSFLALLHCAFPSPDVHGATADTETSLIVPFGDPQAISADLLGVDAAQGRTTWALRQGTYTGTWTNPQGSFPATATLVEGADYASFTYAVPAGPDPGDVAFTVGGECTLDRAAGVAVCVAAGEGTTVTETDSVTAFGVEIASAVTGAAGASGVGASPTGAGSGSGSGASGSLAPASGGSSAPAPTQTGAAASLRAGASALVGLLVAASLT
ncbi:hypothetical protein FB451DRAFT_1497688 [Mycena latifolia]|nr:hypothetical protein FB451DRAFT_1497688 [Mycena latifolia]